MKNIYLHIPGDRDTMSGLVLATVTGSEGSTPQKQGISALFDKNGLVSGTIGGGILEAQVTDISRKALERHKPELVTYSLDNDIPGGEDAWCGGRVSILIDPGLNDQAMVFNRLRDSILKSIPGILVTRISMGGSEILTIDREWYPLEDSNPSVLKESSLTLLPDIREMLSKPGSPAFREIRTEHHGRESLVFMEAVLPNPRLVIAGAGHVGKAVARLGDMLDFEVTVIDDRPQFANRDNIPWASHFIVGDIGRTIEDLKKGKDTYIVIVTRGHVNDAEALRACIGSSAAYVGMMGSRSKVARMRQEFLDKGMASEEQWDSIHSPVGLDISAKTVEEIAVSIAAQLIAVRNKNAGKSFHLHDVDSLSDKRK